MIRQRKETTGTIPSFPMFQACQVVVRLSILSFGTKALISSLRKASFVPKQTLDLVIKYEIGDFENVPSSSGGGFPESTRAGRV